MAMSPHVFWAERVCAGITAAGSRHVVYVPDNPLSHVLRVFADRYPGIRTTVATREEEAFGIAAGLYAGGLRPTVMLQSSGLGNSLNALTSLLIPYRIPVLTIISMRGEPGEWNAAQMPMGRAVGPILDAIEIPYETIAAADQAEAAVKRAAERAFSSRLPAACLLSRHMTQQVST
jgi:sulfopyruvate decarboxylase subunit alpha